MNIPSNFSSILIVGSINYRGNSLNSRVMGIVSVTGIAGGYFKLMHLPAETYAVEPVSLAVFCVEIINMAAVA